MVYALLGKLNGTACSYYLVCTCGYVLIAIMTDYSTQNVALVCSHSFMNKASHEHKLDYTENRLMNL